MNREVEIGQVLRSPRIRVSRQTHASPDQPTAGANDNLTHREHALRVPDALSIKKPHAYSMWPFHQWLCAGVKLAHNH